MRMKIVWIVLGVLALLAVPIVFIMFYGMGELRRLTIHEVDLARVPDGTYEGAYHKGRFRYDVRVTVRDHRITEVRAQQPQHDPMREFATKAERAILDRQSVAVDVVSGASLSTKAFQKAVELALASAPKQH